MPHPAGMAYDPAGRGVIGNASLGLRLQPTAAVTCHTPLIMPPSGSITAEFYGYTTPLDYDTSDGFIAMFPASVNGEPANGLCIDHGMGAPVGPYGNISIDQALNEQTPAVKRAVSFILANLPLLTSDDATEFWSMLGLQNCYPGGLDGLDAWAVGRYVVYDLLGQLPGGIANLEYNTPKNDCLRAGGAALLSMALAFAGGTLDCGDGGLGGGSTGSTGASSTCGCACGGNYTCGGGSCAPDNCPCCDPCGLRLGCQLGKVFCCNTSTPVTDQSGTYLVFAGCPNDIRECCGRVVLGPFRLQSSNAGTPDISLVPCNGCQGADIQLTDFCCNILAAPPRIGDEFYIAFRPPCTRYCFNLCASMMTTARAVYFFRSQQLHIQRIALPLGLDEMATACIQICIDITPETPPPEPEPWWEHVLVNNNNNNNNNDSNSNNDNNDNNSSLMNNLLESLLSNMMSNSLLGGMMNNGMGGGLPPGLWPPGPGPWPPGPEPFPPWPPGPGPNPSDGRFPFPWGLFPPGTTPCPPPDCGGPNPCCCPPPCPPPCWCPPPCPPCPPPCMPWPLPCPAPCFQPPYPYIPEPSLIIQPAIPTYQAMPAPVPFFSPPPYPFPPSYPPYQQAYPQPYPPYSPYPQWDDSAPQPPPQQVYSPVTVVVPPPDPGPWPQYSAPWPPAPFQPPPPEPMPLLLPEISSAPRPDLSSYEFDDFYRDWYGQ